MDMSTHDVWTTTTQPSLVLDTGFSLPVEGLTAFPASPDLSVAPLRAQLVPVARSVGHALAVFGIAAVLMVALPVIALAALLLRFFIVAAAAVAFVVALVLYNAHEPFRAWVRTRVAREANAAS